MTYACHNRDEFAPSVTVQDGWENTWARRMVDMEFRLDPRCVYSTSDLGMNDKGCDGCKWKAGAGTGTPAEPVQVGDSLAGVREVEGEPSSGAGAGDVERTSATAEHGSSDQQARAAEKLEAKYPGAAMYRPINQCDGCRRGLPVTSLGLHHGSSQWDVMACTANRYQPTEES